MASQTNQSYTACNVGFLQSVYYFNEVVIINLRITLSVLLFLGPWYMRKIWICICVSWLYSYISTTIVLLLYIGNFLLGLIFAEFVTSLKSPKIDTAKNNPYYTSSFRVLEIVKMGLGENLTHIPSVVFAKISRREKFPIYGITSYVLNIFK